MSKVPVTILTGHLGAGKTSLLRRMLRNQFGIRIAVIENEFGDEVGIERLFAQTSLNKEGEEDGITVIQSKDLFIELSNGCVCCSVKDNLVNTLEQLLAKNKQRFDHIVIETTGLADPGPLAGIFWLDDELDCEMVLDGVLCVVDVANILHRLSDSRSKEAESQIAYADRIVLNKCDLMVHNELGYNQVVSKVREINPIAPIERNMIDSLDLGFCFNIRAYDTSRLLQQVNLSAQQQQQQAKGQHDTSVTSFVLRQEARPVDLAQLRSWIALLLWEPYAGEIFRIKGIVHAKQDAGAVFAIQGVHTIFDLSPLPNQTWQDLDEKRALTKIVFIGRNLDRERIQREFMLL